MLAFVHGCTEISNQFLGTVFFQNALHHQTLGIQSARAWVLTNFLVHQRLGYGRRVLLVVTQFAETDNVDHHVLLEFHAEVQGQLGHENDRLWIVAIHVKHGCLNHLDHV